MFTGLIEAVGLIEAATPRAGGLALAIRCPALAAGAQRGESIAVDGCCLTVEAATAEGFNFFASPETLARTALTAKAPGQGVNLERSLRLGDRLGGHLVTGHVDAQGRIERYEPAGDAWTLTVAFPPALAPLLVEKGSVAVDGISLTCFDVTGDRFRVAVIPETHGRTTLRERRPGDPVNLEADLLGKYVARCLALRQDGQSSPVTEDLLQRAGFLAGA